MTRPGTSSPSSRPPPGCYARRVPRPPRDRDPDRSAHGPRPRRSTTPSAPRPCGPCSPPSFQNRPARACRRRTRSLVRMLARRDILLVEDDVYGDLSFGGTRSAREGLRRSRRPALRLLLEDPRAGLSGWAGSRPGASRRRSSAGSSRTWSHRRHPRDGDRRLLGEGGYDRHLRRLRRARAAVGALSRRDRGGVPARYPHRVRRRFRCSGRARTLERRRRHPAARHRARHRGRARLDLLGAPTLRQLSPDQHRHPWSPRIERAIATLGALSSP